MFELETIPALLTSASELAEYYRRMSAFIDKTMSNPIEYLRATRQVLLGESDLGTSNKSAMIAQQYMSIAGCNAPRTCDDRLACVKFYKDFVSGKFQKEFKLYIAADQIVKLGIVIKRYQEIFYTAKALPIIVDEHLAINNLMVKKLNSPTLTELHNRNCLTLAPMCGWQ